MEYNIKLLPYINWSSGQGWLLTALLYSFSIAANFKISDNSPILPADFLCGNLHLQFANLNIQDQGTLLLPDPTW